MKIALKSDPTKVYFAYGIYWSDFMGPLKRHYNVIEYHDNLAGFDVLTDEEVDIIEPSLDQYILIEHGIGDQTLVHRAAYANREFYDALVNHDDFKNVEKLFQNMRAMGLEPYYI